MAGTRPADPRNPSDPAYDFTSADASIKAASASGLQVIYSFTGAPAWAEGPNRDPDASPGSWRPDPQALGDFAAALGTRYSGSFPDPAQPGATLPKVKAFQVWNEPNLSKYLTPQWASGRPAAPDHYRRMLNAFYAGLHSTPSDALVVTAGTGPFGDPGPGGNRMMPALFVRELLCLRKRGTKLQAQSCPQPATFDVLAHHPYSVGAPSRKALNDDDVSIPDLGKLIGPLRAAEKAKRVLPAIKHRMWVTEVSYDSSPPDPDGVPATRHAGYLAQTLAILARAGVDTVIWFQVRDQAPDPSFAATNQSGIYLRDGTPKLAQRAFRFPFYAGKSKRRTAVWGRAFADGSVRIERRGNTGWRAVKTLSVKAGQTFETTIPGTGTVRAQLGGFTSLTWRVH